MGRLRDLEHDLHSVGLSLDEIETRFAARWSYVIRRWTRTAVENLAARQPIIAAGDELPPWQMPDEDEVLNVPAASAEAAASLEAVSQVVQQILLETGASAGISFDVRNRIVEQVIADYGRRIGGITEVTRREIMDQLAISYELGESIPKAATRVRSHMNHASTVRGTMIARTELIGAKNHASILAAGVIDNTSLNPDTGEVMSGTTGRDPIILYKEWVATNDSRTRPAHRMASGQIVPRTQPFVVDGEMMNYPGDPNGSAGNVINCRCTVRYTDEAPVLTAGGRPVAKTKITRAGQLRVVPLAAEAPTDSAEMPVNEPGAAWNGILAMEGVETGDGRMIERGAVEWRNLPLTLMAQFETPEFGGHAGAMVAGRIDSISRDGDSIVGSGVFDTGESGQDAQRMVGDQTMRGVSIDLAVDEMELREPDGYDGEPMDEIDLLFEGVMVVLKGTIMGATLCPFPAFEQANVVLASGDGPDRMPGASSTLQVVSGERVRVSFVFPLGIVAAAPPDQGTPAEEDAPNDPADDEAEIQEAAQELANAYPGVDGSITVTIDGEDTVYDFPAAKAASGLTAAAAGLAPEVPPAAWFEAPRLAGPTPLTVTPAGQVFGHVALWGTCHIGLPGCTTPPKSRSGYAYFLTGELEVDDGSTIPVGQLTIGTGHASLTLSRKQTVEHYDHTGWAVADVTAGEDEFGPWVAGAIRPDATDAQVKMLRAAAISGDWRPIKGQLEMVAALAVNVPGFPIPRQQALAASVGDSSYETRALIASGIVTPERAAHPHGGFAVRMMELRAKANYAGAMESLRMRAVG